MLAAGPADAHLIRCYKDGQPTKSERRCALRNYFHATGYLRFLRQEWSPELRAALQPFVSIWKNHSWLREDARLRLDRLDRTLPLVNDWLTAVRVVDSGPYRGSGWWLRSCSSGEGGHGGWIPNSGGSGAGGWMQYMESTFWHDWHRAYADLRSRGYIVPPGAASWYSPLGQALAAGWAYFHARPTGKWLGSGC